MTQAHWIRNARYRVHPIADDGDEGRSVVAASLEEIAQALRDAGATRARVYVRRTSDTLYFELRNDRLVEVDAPAPDSS